MLFEIFRFELRQQLRSPLFWVITLAYLLIGFAIASTDAIMVGGATGNVMRNAPLVITRLTVALCLFGMLLVPIFVANALLRDFEYRIADLFFTTPIGKGSYLGGRFLAGYVAVLIIMAAVLLGIALGGSMPWVDAARLGPSSVRGYAWTFSVFVAPDMLFLAGLLSLLAVTTRSLLGVYIGILAFFALNLMSSALAQDLNNHFVAALIDPFGARTLSITTRYWTADQINHQLPPLDGVLLFNRALWTGIAIALFAGAYGLFRTNREGLQLRKAKHRAEPPMLRPQGAGAEIRVPKAPVRHDAGARWVQLRRLMAFDMASVFKGVPFLVMLIFGLMNLIIGLVFAGKIFGTATYPITLALTNAVRGGTHWLLYIILTFYAGELVWRDRTQRVAEVSDTFAIPDWLPMLSRMLSLVAVSAVYQATGYAVGILWQLAHGFTHIEPGLYASQYGIYLIDPLLFAAFALFMQVISNNKFFGYLLTILWFVWSIGFGLLHWDDNLYIYGSTPDLPYSDMNGYGHFLPAKLWFDFYWALCAAVLLCLAALFWTRGTDQVWRQRLREAGTRAGRPMKLALAVFVIGFVACGSWIFYNTHILNKYQNSEALQRAHAEYEKRYAKYRDLPQPRIVSMKSQVDIYPDSPRRLEIRMHYVLTNKHNAPITDLHVNTNSDFTMKSLTFAPHDVISDDKPLGYTIYRLKTPLAPGASMDFDFDMEYAPKGFTNEPQGKFLAGNGTFFNSGVLPSFGYQPGEQLTDHNDRRKHGLPADVPRMPKLGDEKARANTYIANDADWLDFDTTVSTSADQIALAPGYLQKEWTEGNRHYFHYVMDKPMLPFAAWLSARYAVRRDHWKDIAIEVYYNPAHAWNVDRMIQGVKDALAYYDTNYTPYQFRQVRILEFPNYASFAQSFANTIPFSESIGFIADLRDPTKIDYPYYVTAHEVAHQWWAHQVIGANMQGSTMLSESLAQYSSLMVMEHRYGSDQMRKFLKYELDQYLSSRAGETVEEEPLARVENQQYIHYRKGSLIFYALKDYIGEQNFDAMLKKFLQAKQYQQPPYTTSQEFMDMLSASVDPKWKPLLDDFFWKITLYDNRMVSATAKKLPNGKYEVSMKVHAAKFYVDGKGKETEASPDIPVDIGVFAASPGNGQDGKPLYLEKRSVPKGDSTITVEVDSKPAEAGIDPYNKLIDRVSADNRAAVSLQ
ncbi:ABC transporter permease/M1 family aminopeptidase [Dyella sp.]|uniref:ABC transporter permease/M1 family aminopeptidase n=1 Tax=Dyella sp. TaxID=1869338 RepID=UPI002ED2C384